MKTNLWLIHSISADRSPYMHNLLFNLLEGPDQNKTYNTCIMFFREKLAQLPRREYTVTSDSAVIQCYSPMGGELRNDFFTHHFFSLTTAVISGGDLHCRVFMFCNVDCWLELEGKCTLHHGDSKTGEMKKSDRESLVVSNWPLNWEFADHIKLIKCSQSSDGAST